MKQALHGKWLPRIATEIVASLGRCPYGAASPDREAMQRTTFFREEQYQSNISLLSRLSWRRWAVQVNVCVWKVK